jgi:hypothetical protein
MRRRSWLGTGRGACWAQRWARCSARSWLSGGATQAAGWICFEEENFFVLAPFSSTLGAFGNSLLIILLVLFICFHFKLPCVENRTRDLILSPSVCLSFVGQDDGLRGQNRSKMGADPEISQSSCYTGEENESRNRTYYQLKCS